MKNIQLVTPAYVVKSRGQRSCTEDSGPDELRGMDDDRTKESRQTEARQKCSQCHQNFESPAGLEPIEHLLLGQDVSTKADVDTEVGHDVDENVLLALENISRLPKRAANYSMGLPFD